MILSLCDVASTRAAARGSPSLFQRRKDVEIVVFRHELAVCRRRIGVHLPQNWPVQNYCGRQANERNWRRNSAPHISALLHEP